MSYWNYFYDFWNEHVHSPIKNQIRATKTYNELSRLSNRELQDLGITRGDIPYLSYQSSFEIKQP